MNSDRHPNATLKWQSKLRARRKKKNKAQPPKRYESVRCAEILPRRQFYIIYRTPFVKYARTFPNCSAGWKGGGEGKRVGPKFMPMPKKTPRSRGGRKSHVCGFLAPTGQVCASCKTTRQTGAYFENMNPSYIIHPRPHSSVPYGWVLEVVDGPLSAIRVTKSKTLDLPSFCLSGTTRPTGYGAV